MILQALYDYYERSPQLPRFGFESKEFYFAIIIDETGSFHSLESLLVGKKRGLYYAVPRHTPRSGKHAWKNANLLWDTYGYLLAHPKDAANADDVEKARLQQSSFIAKLEALPEELKQTRGIHAILEFYRREEWHKVFNDPNWEQCAGFPGCNLLFRLQGEPEPITSDPAVVAYVESNSNAAPSDDETENDGTPAPVGRCLVTGERGPLIRLMNATPVPGGKSTAALVSFQTNSGYDSYGREQCYNAPMSAKAEFCCTTALNALLGKDSQNKFNFGSDSLLFWTQRKEEQFSVEQLMTMMFSGCDNPDDTQKLHAMLKAGYTGNLAADTANNRYYLLGLAPNAARISVTVFKTGVIGELCSHMEQHFIDLQLVCSPQYDKPFTLLSLLCATVPEGKMENVQPNMKRSVLNAIMDGTPYPVSWFEQTLRRIGATREFSRNRIAVLKAYLNRKERFYPSNNKEITMGLDKDNDNIGYLCGRLFAVLVKNQEDAIDVKAGILERYYGSASSTPILAFGRLLGLTQHHLENLSGGAKVNRNKLMQEIIGKIKDFPAQLSLEDQGRFAIGYYHQMQDFFTPKADKANNNTQDNQ